MYPVIKNSTYLSKKANGQPYDKPIFHEKPLLAITFDDGILSDYTVAFPEMTSRGIKGTSYIIGSHPDSGLNQRMSWVQIKELQDSDMWDIQSHTFNHIRSSEATEQELVEDYNNQTEVFEQNGLKKPEHLAYPFGAHSDLSHQVYDTLYKSSRLTNYSHTNVNRYESFNVNSIMSVTGDTNDDEKLQFVKDAIDYAIENNGLLTLYLHQITPNVGTYPSATARVYFDKILDYVVASEIETVTISEMVDHVEKYKQST